MCMRFEWLFIIICDLESFNTMDDKEMRKNRQEKKEKK